MPLSETPSHKEPVVVLMGITRKSACSNSNSDLSLRNSAYKLRSSHNDASFSSLMFARVTVVSMRMSSSHSGSLLHEERERAAAAGETDKKRHWQNTEGEKAKRSSRAAESATPVSLRRRGTEAGREGKRISQISYQKQQDDDTTLLLHSLFFDSKMGSSRKFTQSRRPHTVV